MDTLDGCQIAGLPRMADGHPEKEHPSLIKCFKRAFAKPWNDSVKKWLKKGYSWTLRLEKQLRPGNKNQPETVQVEVVSQLHKGDQVRVHTVEEIQATLNPWKELKGCAFLEDMKEYCGTTQVVLQPMTRFLDERDYQVKKSKGIVLLENVVCHGTPVFGRCDRCCFLFWREEWLEKI